MRKYIVIIPDGAADRNRDLGCSPLAAARTPAMDRLAREGVSGSMQTLYVDLPRESMVAQLGMLGWDPRVYYPHGRASAELLANGGVRLRPGDLALRANFVRMEGPVLETYNADYIASDAACSLVRELRAALTERFPEFELYHQSDFRNTLVVRNARIHPREIASPEPHEGHGCEFDLRQIVVGSTEAGLSVAARINEYIFAAAGKLRGCRANALFPWSPSGIFRLPPFEKVTGFTGRTAIVGFVDFLAGIAKEGGLEFHRVGNGRPETDYEAKGKKVIELLEGDCALVICHINGPDEASHMSDVAMKVRCLERIDEWIAAPVFRYFASHPEQLGGVVVMPDHFSNIIPKGERGKRSDIHSLDAVPFALWNGRDRDHSVAFNEAEAQRGSYADAGLNHLDLLPLLFGAESGRLNRCGASAGSISVPS
jgi:2,3-bisphosphoglycerate-independent phosphoglycerate mutase